MARNLITLIQSAGNAGTAGQSFRNQVLGAGAGIKLTDYLVTGWSWSGRAGRRRDL
jgi:hypothetical protein